jgi:translation initiation factor IF-2
MAFQNGRGNKPYGKKPYGGGSRGDKPYGNRPNSDRGDKPFEKKPYDKKPYGGKPYGDKPYGDKPYGDKPYGNRPYGDRDGKPFEKKPYEKKPYGDKPYGDKPYGDKPYGNRPYGDRDGKPFEKKPYEKKPYEKKPYGDKPYGGRPYNKKPYEDADRSFPEAPQTDDRPDAAVSETNELPYFLMGRNAVREAIKSGRSIDRILVVEEQDGSLREIIGMAAITSGYTHCRPQAAGRVVYALRAWRQAATTRATRHGAGYRIAALDDILPSPRSAAEQPFLLLHDEINDPHNLGSMLRSAACAGEHGVYCPSGARRR